MEMTREIYQVKAWKLSKTMTNVELMKNNSIPEKGNMKGNPSTDL